MGTKPTYELINSDNLDEVKPLITEGLSRICKRDSEAMPPEKVFYMIEKMQVVALSIYIDNSLVGFVTASLSTDFDGVLALRGQLAYVRQNSGIDMAEEGFVGAEVMARTFGAARIRFESMRKGWVPKAEANGYIASVVGRRYVFSKELT